MTGLRARLRNTLWRLSGASERRWRDLPAHLYCFNYHRIGNREETPFDPNVFSCTAEHFDHHLTLIKRDFQLIDLEELIELVQSGVGTKERLALLTFDDGYVDGYTEALPVLQQHGASGVFFVTADFVGASEAPWWDRVAWWLRHATTERCRVPDLGLDLPLGNGGLDGQIRTVLSALKRHPARLDEYLANLHAALAPDAALPEEARLFMDWEQLRALAAAGMHIGSHTQTHRILAHLDDEELTREIAGSRDYLREHLGSDIRALAYPVGTAGTFDERALNAARDAGYDVAFSFLERSNPLPVGDPYSICRIGIDSNPDVEGFKLKVGASVPR
jgi:peptidoglycan/xylan/chitin deacetylase (PgdA/CDA1 family)